MYATIREYTGVTDRAVDELRHRRAELEALVRRAPGLARYDLIRTAGGVTSVTVCANWAGTEDCDRWVATWVEANIPALLPNPPHIAAGEGLIHVTRG
jgi:hypothetical protein